MGGLLYMCVCVCVCVTGLMAMFSLMLILIDWYDNWNEPMERVDMYVCMYVRVCVCV